MREALAAFLAMQPKMQRHGSQFVIAGDVALVLTRWTLDGSAADGSAIQMRGEATDILRRQADGNWRVVIDNPWGVSLLAA